MAHIVGQYIDQIMTTELRSAGNMPRGVAHLLYAAVRSKAPEPLSTHMARSLHDTIQPGDRVLILCGAGGYPSLPTGEIDGVLGAVAMARVLTLGLGAKVHLATAERFVAPLAAVLRAGELNVVLDEHDVRADAVTLHISPEEDAEGKLFSERILDDLDPRAVIAIELLSVNDKGVIHGATGNAWHDVHYDVAPLFARARERGIRTYGIGDAGNEAGFGAIPEVKVIQPEGARCRCGCGGGMASAVVADVVLAAAISNWGGYAVTALLAFMTRRPDLLAGPNYVEQMLRTAVDAGLVCGWNARPTLSDDGVPLDAQRAAATLMHTAVVQALTEVHSPSH